MKSVVFAAILFTLVGRLAAAPKPVTHALAVDGFTRLAVVYPGTRSATRPAPVVLAFHGFGGTAEGFAYSTRLHEQWPEAIVVYPDGLLKWSTRSKKYVHAWQAEPGMNDDRDVHLVDALLEMLAKTYPVDTRRLYVTGCSNGALFAYVLLTLRGDKFAAFAPVAGAVEFVARATLPRPVLIIQGKKDGTVKPEAAMRTRDILLALNGCGTREVEWDRGYISFQPCASGQPVIWRLHGGGHEWPAEASPHIVRFFQECTP